MLLYEDPMINTVVYECCHVDCMPEDLHLLLSSDSHFLLCWIVSSFIVISKLAAKQMKQSTGVRSGSFKGTNWEIMVCKAPKGPSFITFKSHFLNLKELCIYFYNTFSGCILANSSNSFTLLVFVKTIFTYHCFELSCHLPLFSRWFSFPHTLKIDIEVKCLQSKSSCSHWLILKKPPCRPLWLPMSNMAAQWMPGLIWQ